MNQVPFETTVNQDFSSRVLAWAEQDGRQFPVTDLSPDHMTVADNAYLDPKRPFDLVFPFATFDLRLAMTASHRRGEILGSSSFLLKPDGKQRQTLRYLIDACLSGELLVVNNVLEVSARAANFKVAEPPLVGKKRGGFRRIVRKIAGYAFVLALTISLPLLLGAALYQRMFVIEAPVGTISADIIRVAATGGGQVKLFSASTVAEAGTILAEITERAGAVTTVVSPCRCRVVSADTTNGTYVDPGQTLMTLLPEGAQIFVTTSLPRDRAQGVLQGSSIDLTFADGTQVKNAVLMRPPSLPLQLNRRENRRDSNDVVFKIQPGIELSPNRIGEPVYVSFDLFDHFAGRMRRQAQTTWENLGRIVQ